MALKTRKEYYDAFTNIKTKELYRASRLISKLTGTTVQHSKAIIGKNAFRHESGLHVAAILSNPVTYECVQPEILGLERKFILGKHSGRIAVMNKLASMNLDIEDEHLKKVVASVKERAIRIRLPPI